MNIRIFITITVAILVLALAQGDIQNLGQLENFYDFYGDAIVDDVFSFTSHTEAEEIVSRIMKHTGLATNFILKSSNVPNATAQIVNGERLILYNLGFIQKIKQDANTDWAATTLVAHEIAHHLNWHTFDVKSGDRIIKELEADYFAGFYLAKMGATLEETRAVYLTLPEEGSVTHPPRSARLAQIDNGWYESAGTSNSTLEPDPLQDNLVDPPEIPLTPALTTGNITINSVPNGAMVYINNAYIGNTPLQDHILEGGNHSLKLIKAGYEDLDGEFRVGVGQGIEREFTLEAVVPSNPTVTLPPPAPPIDKPISPPTPTKKSVANDTQSISHNSDWTPVEKDFNGTIMVLVPAGSFMMGSENGDPDEKPVHIQKFDNPFWIDKTEVTRGAYKKCVSARKCEVQPSNKYSEKSNQPINHIDWYEATTYCKWRGARLPTEREWEYAARGSDNLTYPWGNDFNKDKLHSSENLDNKTTSVGNYPNGASWVGALDMAGNVWEWTNSLYKFYPYTQNDNRELTGNEKNIINDKRITLRGGSFGYGSDFARSTSRTSLSASLSDPLFGFRCTLTQNTNF